MKIRLNDSTDATEIVMLGLCTCTIESTSSSLSQDTDKERMAATPKNLKNLLFIIYIF